MRYIKLGENGKWATKALQKGILPFGYRSIDHRSCLIGDWDEVRRQLVVMGRSAQGASQGLREIKDFYGLPADTLWVTAADGHFGGPSQTAPSSWMIGTIKMNPSGIGGLARGGPTRA